MANEEWISISSIAREMGMDRTGLIRAMKRGGLTVRKFRTVESGGQWENAVKRVDVEAWKAKRESEFLH